MKSICRKVPRVFLITLICAFLTSTGVTAEEILRKNSEKDVKDILFFSNPIASITRFEKSPTIDGVLDDVAWAAAGRIEPFQNYKTGINAKIQTVVLAGFDSENLYLAFKCREPEIARLKKREIMHDSLALFRGDSIIEVFIKTNPTSDVYYQFAVDASGNHYESKIMDASWNPNWHVASKVGGKIWYVEMAIPWNAITKTKETPQFLLANFCRSRRIKPGELSCWSATFGGFHNPSRFGSIILDQKPPLSCG